ncbi:MAG TPA: hypothetical protein VH165_02170 [Kofleriaceae bacterium]|nr:hypothetical protein [Kofleriaceae bacterium]
MKPRELAIALALAASGCAHHGSATEAAQQQSAAVAVGAKAPDGQLTQATGTQIALADVLQKHGQTVVVFYRGFF